MIPALAILIALSGGTELVAEDESTDTESALLLGVQAGPYSWGARAGRDDGDTEIEYADGSPLKLAMPNTCVLKWGTTGVSGTRPPTRAA